MTEKEEWIIEYISDKKALPFVDMLDEDFVNAFVETFNCDFEDMTLGAVKCKELSKLLSSMYKKKLLNRFPHGVKKGYNQDYKCFKSPKWVYSYELPRKKLKLL
jgi:hypothetical protein